MADELDFVDIERANAAGARIRVQWPSVFLGGLSEKESSAWIRGQEALIAEACVGAPRSGNRAWLDVLLEDGRWVGRWFEECALESAIHCAYSWGTIVAAGVGLKAECEAADARAAREAAGDMLLLLGDDW